MFSFHIPNMTCGGCAKTVTRILHGVDPQARVETDPPRREARVEHSGQARIPRGVERRRLSGGPLSAWA